MQDKCEFKLEDIEKIVRDFNYVKQFSLSDTKLLMWNHKSILQGNIDKIAAKKKVSMKKILLEIAQLSDCLSVNRDKKKLSKLMEDKNSAQAAHDRNDRREQVKDSDDYFELVECRDVMVNVKA